MINAVGYALKNMCANPGRAGHSLSQFCSVNLYRAREEINSFFNGSGAETVIFCKNCTEALNTVIKGVTGKYDEIIISDLEHNAVLRPVVKTGLFYKTFSVSPESDEETVENFKNALTDKTKLAVVTAASNVTGRILPVEKIGKICKEKGILFCVDAAQGGGVIPIDIKKMNIDFLCIAGHKGLYAPMGTGVLIANKEIKNTLTEGGNGMDSLKETQEPVFPEGFESGTVSLPNIMGLKAGTEFVRKKNRESIYKNELNLIQHIYGGLKENKNIILYTPFPEMHKYAPVLSFNVKGTHSEETAEYLSANGIAVRGGFHCSKLAHEKLGTEETGTVRISPAYFNTLFEAKYFLRVISKF